jgi:hypothetical protein
MSAPSGRHRAGTHIAAGILVFMLRRRRFVRALATVMAAAVVSTRSSQVTESSNARSNGFPRVLRVRGEVLVARTSAEGVRVAVRRLDN